MKRNAICIIAAIMVMALAVSVAQADHRIVQRVHNAEFKAGPQTMPATDDTTITWISDGFASTSQGDSTTAILDVAANTMYTVNHATKKYSEMSLGGIGDAMAGAFLEQAGGDSAAAKGMASQMLSMMKMTVTVTPTEETKKVGAWDCKKYLMEASMGMGGKTSSEIWATEDISVDYSTYAKIAHSMMSQLPDFDEALKEMMKVKGMPVLNITTVSAMGASMETRQEVLSVDEMDAPAGVFNIPDGYEKTEMKLPGM